MLALDPAMLSHPPPPDDDDDSDYEYEYHDSETETFFLNIDLTTHHGPIRPPRRRNDPSTIATPTAVTSTSAPPPHADEQEPTIASTETHNVSAERVQILGLHTPNPIISYHNQIFSGLWADQLGTELFFSRSELDSPQLDSDSPSAPTHIVPLRHNKDFDLIAASSVKILGRRANLISSSGSGPAPLHENIQLPIPSSSSPPPLSSAIAASRMTPDPSTFVYKPESQTNQARFLERLMKVKRAKGETDTVRTVFSFRRGVSLEERLRGWARTDEQIAVIQRLNQKALQGDSEAMVELENIYAQLANQDPEPSPEGTSHHPG